ncbi:MAG TPA: hypothetical protein VMA72_22275 [Streptosporangiaceae bacterium]|nr:hypothetical protein [Streptosporangiaceae bacterium]
MSDQQPREPAPPPVGSDAAGPDAAGPLPRFDASALLARQLAEIDAPVELTEAEIAALPLSSDEPPDLSETPWWLTDEFYGSDDAEHASWLAGLPADVRTAYEKGPWDGSGEVFAAGFLHHDPGDGPAGPGFIAGGWADTAAPGLALAAAAADAATRRAQLGESELIGLLCGWQRLTAWTQAEQARCLTTLVQRRKDQSVELSRPDLAAHVDDEVAAALALTSRAASRQLDVSAGLGRLPEVDAALAAGRIDWAKASLFTDLLAGIPDQDANDIAGLVLTAGDVTRKTTGQLRAALTRAILAYDPDAAQRRREEARKDASVQAWPEPSATLPWPAASCPPLMSCTPTLSSPPTPIGSPPVACPAMSTSYAPWPSAPGSPDGPSAPSCSPAPVSSPAGPPPATASDVTTPPVPAPPMRRPATPVPAAATAQAPTPVTIRPEIPTAAQARNPAAAQALTPVTTRPEIPTAARARNTAALRARIPVAARPQTLAAARARTPVMSALQVAAAPATTTTQRADHWAGLLT